MLGNTFKKKKTVFSDRPQSFWLSFEREGHRKNRIFFYLADRNPLDRLRFDKSLSSCCFVVVGEPILKSVPTTELGKMKTKIAPEKILHISNRLFDKQAYSGVGIAKKMGLIPQTLYFYFKKYGLPIERADELAALLTNWGMELIGYANELRELAAIERATPTFRRRKNARDVSSSPPSLPRASLASMGRAVPSARPSPEQSILLELATRGFQRKE